MQRCRNFCFHDGRIATAGTRPYEKRVKSPSKGKRASPKKSKKAKPHEPAGLTGQTLRKRRVLATAAGQNPRNSHESQRGQEGPRKNHMTPSNGGGANLTKEGYKTGGPQDKNEGLQYRYETQEKGPPRLRRTFSGTNSLCERGIPLHDAAVQERLGIGSISVNHAEPCLTLGGLPNLSAQTNARKNRRSEVALEASHCLGMTREQQGDCMAHCHALNRSACAATAFVRS